MELVKKATWDTDFFGYNVGTLDVSNGEEVDKILTASNDFRLIYIMADQPIETTQSKLVDIKVMLTRNLEHEKSYSECNELEIFDKEIDSFEDLENLALQSGVYSRFNLDSNFVNYEYERMYKAWLAKSIQDSSIDVLIKKISGKIVGFVTLVHKGAVVGEMGLLAVDTNYRGMGIAKELVQSCIAIGVRRGYKEINLMTQGDNLQAMNLYKKYKFLIRQTKYIYHYWNI